MPVPVPIVHLRKPKQPVAGCRPTIYQASLRSASRLYASGASPMQSFMAVPVDTITRMHGLSHRAQGLARNGCVVSDEAATQERCGAYLGRCSP